MTYQNFSLKQLQEIDGAHHLHPFTDHKDLRAAGTRIITRADGPFIYDSEGNELLDGMAGLWCVNVGYGRHELAEAAYAQMKELPYYNSFFRCSTPTPVLLSRKLAEIAPAGVKQVFYGSSGSESNDTALRLVRHYWALEGKPEKTIIVSRRSAYHGSTVAGASLGGMAAMHSQLGAPVPGIVHAMARMLSSSPCQAKASMILASGPHVRSRMLSLRRGRKTSPPLSASRSWAQAASRFRRRATGLKSSASVENTKCC